MGHYMDDVVSLCRKCRVAVAVHRDGLCYEHWSGEMTTEAVYTPEEVETLYAELLNRVGRDLVIWAQRLNLPANGKITAITDIEADSCRIHVTFDTGEIEKAVIRGPKPPPELYKLHKFLCEARALNKPYYDTFMSDGM